MRLFGGAKTEWQRFGNIDCIIHIYIEGLTDFGCQLAFFAVQICWEGGLLFSAIRISRDSFSRSASMRG